MARPSKKQKTWTEKVQPGQTFAIEEAIALVKDLATAKFTESIDVAVNLGVDPKKSDQVVRGSTVLPHGTGKSIRVAVMAQGENVDKAKDAGADLIGFEDLAEKIKGGEIDFDLLIATPDAMRVVGPLGQILGPRGLMPNPKVGTVTADVATAVKNAKAGQVRYKTDKAGIIHCAIGVSNFDAKSLRENLDALLADLVKAKPASAKGVYLKSLTLSSTMGPGIHIDQATI